MSHAPYEAGLGVEVVSVAAEEARIRVPFREANSNPGRALHGGVVASAIDVAAALVARAGAGDTTAMACGAVDVSVDYLAAAIGEDVVAAARVLRRGKELAYVAVDVATTEGKAIATGLVTYRCAAPGAHDRQLHRAPPSLEPPDVATLPPFARIFATAPFMARLGLAPRTAHDGTAAVVLPWSAANADAAGALHEGAVAALVDTTAAIASWSLVPLDPRNKASTVGLHVTLLETACDEDVVAHARTLRRNEELFLNLVEVRGARAGQAIAVATVTYRIVVPQ